VLNRDLGRDPNDRDNQAPQRHLTRATTLRQLAQLKNSDAHLYEDALTSVDRAIALDKENPLYLIEKAKLLCVMGRWQEAQVLDALIIIPAELPTERFILVVARRIKEEVRQMLRDSRQTHSM
jgi:hypothetical protein